MRLEIAEFSCTFAVEIIKKIIFACVKGCQSLAILLQQIKTNRYVFKEDVIFREDSPTSRRK
jgi:hypothetical protein